MTCSRFTIETLEQGVYMFQINNKDIKVNNKAIGVFLMSLFKALF